MRAVHGAERVLDEQVAVVGELARELGIVFRLARVEAGVLEHADFGHARPKLLLDGLHRVRGIGPLRPAEMGADCHLGGFVLEQVLQRRERRADARVVRDASVLERHVQVGAH